MTLEWVWLMMAGGLLVWITYAGIQIREQAVAAARDYCQRHGLQFLDQTVARKRTSISRDRSGAVRVWRSFGFEFTSDGETRYSGEIVMLGRRIQRIDSDAHRIIH